MAEKAKFDREAAFKSIIGAGRQSENAVAAEEKNGKKNSDRVQRAYYLDRDIDKALRRMALRKERIWLSLLMMLCVKDLWSIFDRICVKECGRQAIFA